MPSAALLPNLSASYVFTFFLLLEQLALTRDITAVALGRNVLTYSLDGFAGYDFGSDRCLNGYVKLLARYEFLQFLAHAAAECHGIVNMSEC